MSDQKTFIIQSLKSSGITPTFKKGKLVPDSDYLSFILRSVEISEKEWNKVQVERDVVRCRIVKPQLSKI